MALTLTTDERDELERRRRSRKIRAEDARRAAVILMLADGASFTATRAGVGWFPDYNNGWSGRAWPVCGRSIVGNRRRSARPPSKPASWPRRDKRRRTAARTG